MTILQQNPSSFDFCLFNSFFCFGSLILSQRNALHRLEFFLLTRKSSQTLQWVCSWQYKNQWREKGRVIKRQIQVERRWSNKLLAFLLDHVFFAGSNKFIGTEHFQNTELGEEGKLFKYTGIVAQRETLVQWIVTLKDLLPLGLVLAEILYNRMHVFFALS